MGSIGHRSCDEFVCFQIGIKYFWLYFSEKLPLSKSMLLQSIPPCSEDPFLTIFYTTNSSPESITKSVFKLILVLSNYQTCTFPFKKILMNKRKRELCLSIFNLFISINRLVLLFMFLFLDTFTSCQHQSIHSVIILLRKHQ